MRSMKPSGVYRGHWLRRIDSPGSHRPFNFLGDAHRLRVDAVRDRLRSPALVFREQRDRDGALRAARAAITLA
jgi:hypothetical protein